MAEIMHAPLIKGRRQQKYSDQDTPAPIINPLSRFISFLNNGYE
jgi:hypothetical protein